MRAVSSGTDGTSCSRRSDMGDLRTRKPSNAMAHHKAADFANGVGAFGGGLAVLGIPLLSLVADPIDAAIIVAPLLCLMDVVALGAFGPSTWTKPDLLWLVPGLVIGIASGAAFFTAVDPHLVTLTIALITLGFTAHYFLKGRTMLLSARPLARGPAVAAGIAAGFTTFVAHSGGPPIAMYLLRRG